MIELRPDAGDALADLQALADGPWRSEPDFLELVRSLIDDGSPLLEIESVSALGANGRIVRYKLADRLKAFMMARLARAAEADAAKVKRCVHHDGGLLLKSEPSA